MSITALKEEMDNLEEVDIQDLINQLTDLIGEEEPDRSFSPQSKLEASRWLKAYLKIQEEQDWLKDEYLVQRMQEVIDPIKKKLSSMDQQKDIIKSGLMEFIQEHNDGEKVSFPDLGTAYVSKSQPKLLYPKDENGLIEKLIKQGDKRYVVEKYSLDKKKLLQYYKDNNEVPIEGITAESASENIVVRAAKKKKE